MYRWVLSWGRGAEPAPGQREEGAEGAELGTWAESTSLWKVGGGGSQENTEIQRLSESFND